MRLGSLAAPAAFSLRRFGSCAGIYTRKGQKDLMSKIIAVTSGKGGTGKSSISACLGYALAKQGNRTLIIELDFGLRCMDIMLGMQGNITYDLGDVLEGTCDVYKATTTVKLASNLSVLCAPSDPFVQLKAQK